MVFHICKKPARLGLADEGTSEKRTALLDGLTTLLWSETIQLEMRDAFAVLQVGICDHYKSNVNILLNFHKTKPC